MATKTLQVTKTVWEKASRCSKEGFLQATVELALQHPDVGESFREYLKALQF